MVLLPSGDDDIVCSFGCSLLPSDWDLQKIDDQLFCSIFSAVCMASDLFAWASVTTSEHGFSLIEVYFSEKSAALILDGDFLNRYGKAADFFIFP